MAYIKFKELSNYFNFNKEIPIKEIPEYIKQYVLDGENILKVYSTRRDRCLFTDEKLVIFDQKGLGGTKKIQIFPYDSIDSTAIVYKRSAINLLFTFKSGYQMRLNFVNLSPEEKTELRLIYTEMASSYRNR